MSQQRLHKLVVTFNKLDRNDPKKNRLGQIIKQEIVNRGNKPAQTTFSLT